MKEEEYKKRIEELEIEKEYYKGEAESYWVDLRKRQKFNLKIAQHIVKVDGKAVANIILNMYFGKIPSDSVSFCEIFELKEKEYCKVGKRCTDCIDDFLKEYYQNR